MANMSNKWDGFTEDDIKKISTKEKSPGLSKQESVSKSSKTQKASIKNITRDQILKNNPKKIENDKNVKVSEQIFEEIHRPQINKPKENEENNISAENNKEVNIVIREQEPGMFTNIEEFQIRQKLMEEKNKMTKELLSKAISDRSKKTSAEAKRLLEIQNELQTLDNILSNDVCVLRNQIETASFEFMEAQKKYDKAEKEFLDAKLLKFTKLEKKELLTQHLCTIIEQNELRKANKLAELMTKLEIEAYVDSQPEETPIKEITKQPDEETPNAHETTNIS